MAREPIRTMREVLDKALEMTGKNELYTLDNELVTQFKLETLKGTTTQLMTVIQALRTAALAVTGAAVNALTDLENEPEEDEDNHHYDA